MSTKQKPSTAVDSTSEVAVDTIVNTTPEVAADNALAPALETLLKYTFIVCGEKGGVGKTWFAWLLIECLMKNNIFPTIVDMDRTTPNVAKAYAKAVFQGWDKAKEATVMTKTKNSDSKRGKTTQTRLEELLQDQLTLSDSYEEVVNRDRLVEIVDLSDHLVVSMPSQSQKGFCYWLDETDLVASAVNPQIVLFWVSDGSIESLKLLETFMPKYPDLKYCLVLNHGIGVQSKWDDYQLEDVSEILNQRVSEKSLQVITMDKLLLSPELVMTIQEQGLTFGDILQDGGGTYNRNFLTRLKMFLEKGFKSITNTGYINVASNSAK
jgi:hypothetical protein